AQRVDLLTSIRCNERDMLRPRLDLARQVEAAELRLHRGGHGHPEHITAGAGCGKRWRDQKRRILAAVERPQTFDIRIAADHGLPEHKIDDVDRRSYREGRPQPKSDD